MSVQEIVIETVRSIGASVLIFAIAKCVHLVIARGDQRKKVYGQPICYWMAGTYLLFEVIGLWAAHSGRMPGFHKESMLGLALSAGWFIGIVHGGIRYDRAFPLAPLALKMKVRRLASADYAVWSQLRWEMWPTLTVAEFEAEQTEILESPTNNAVFVAELDSGEVIGFAEFFLRSCAEGCSTRIVGDIHGWYVAPQYRQRGVGKELRAAGEEWALERGAATMVSDAEIDNRLRSPSKTTSGF